MLSARKSLWFFLGFAATTAITLALVPLPAAGQILDPAPRPTPPSRPNQRQPALDAAESPRFDDGSVVPTTRARARPRESDGDLEVDGDGERDGQAWSSSVQRATGQDGDLDLDRDDVRSRDGVIVLSEPRVPQDGDDPVNVDMRAREDIAAFEIPPDGFDSLLFQIEELNPIFDDRRPERFFRLEPYNPVGIRIGSFVLFPEVEIDEDYNSNLFSSPQAESDVAFEARPAGRLVSNWGRHAVEFRGSGDFSFHDRFPSENDRAYLLEGRGRVDITHRSNIQGLLAREVSQESRSAINASSVGTRPQVTADLERISINHRFNRLSLQLRGSVLETDYGDTSLDDLTISNADRNYTAYDEAGRAKWEFNPNLFLFTDIGINQRDYKIAATSDGIKRSSTGERYRVGLSFGDTGAYLRGEVSLGYGRQKPDSSRLDVIDGILIDANLAWRVTALTSLLFTAATDVAETTTVDSGGVMQRLYGIEARHAFGRYLIASTSLGYLTRDFVGASLNESEIAAGLGLEYFVSSEVVLFSRYQHTAFDTTDPGGDYGVDEVRLGMRLRR